MKYKTNQAKLSKLHRFVCLGITGTMRRAPAAAVGSLLGLTFLLLKLEAKAQAGMGMLAELRTC
jgi:hypothetical protein